MSNELVGVLGKIAFVALIVSLLADSILCSTMNRTYFTIGVPLFIKRIQVDNRHTNIPPQSLFEAEFKSELLTPFTFKELDSNIYGFRERFLQYSWKQSWEHFRYLPLMHGSLIFDKKKNQVVVVGIANWLTLWFALYISVVWLNRFIMLPVQIIDIASFAFFVLVFGFQYAIQHTRFSKVANFAAEHWTRKHVINSGGV